MKQENIDIVQKQSFLYQQIIQCGFSPSQFQQFIVNQNSAKGMDLALWTMQQLKFLTQKFKTQKQKQEKQQKEKGSLLQSNIQSQISISTPQKIAYTKNQQYSRVIKCKKTQLKPLQEDLVVVMDNYQKVEGGIFQKNYINFQIKIDILKASVFRRYSDFEWLRQILSIQYPGLPIPPIAHKGKIKRKEQKHIYKRMYILQKFLNRLIAIPEMRASQTLHKFLTLKNQKQFQQYKAKFKNTKAIPLEMLQNMEGQIELKLQNSTNNLLIKTQKYLNANQPQVKRIYKDFKGAATMLQNCSQFLKSIGNNCRNLNFNLNMYKKQCQLPITKNNIFSLLENMTYKCALLLQQQAQLYRKEVYSMIKYESFYMININECLQKLNTINQQYINHKIALNKRKQKLFDQGNLMKWQTTQKLTVKPVREEAYEIMLPKQTKQLLKQRQNYALLNYQLYKQIVRDTKANNKMQEKYLEEIIKIESGIASRGLMVWADLLISVKDINTIVS